MLAIKRRLGVLVVLLLAVSNAVLMSACESTATRRSTGETLDDAGLTASVKSAIARTEGVGDAFQVNVDTYRGVVSLSGFADSEKQIAAMVAAARKVGGVKDVKNNLSVKPGK